MCLGASRSSSSCPSSPVSSGCSTPAAPPTASASSRGGGAVVDPDRSLAAQGITDGAVLSLETVDVTTEKVYDDVVEAVADAVETQFAPWTARHSAGTAIGAATVFLLCAAYALFTARESGLLVTAVAGAISVLLVGTAAVLSSRTQATGALALACTALVYAAVAGFAVDPSAPLWGEGLLYAGAAVAVVGVLAAAVVGRHRLVLAAGAVVGAAMVVHRRRERHRRPVDDDGVRRRLRRRGRARQRPAVARHLLEPAHLPRPTHRGRDRRRRPRGRPRAGPGAGGARSRRHGRRGARLGRGGPARRRPSSSPPASPARCSSSPATWPRCCAPGTAARARPCSSR